MRVTFLAALAAALLACQQPSAPEAGETLGEAIPSSGTGQSELIVEEVHQGC